VARILASFGMASGLITNTDKSAVYPIRCEGLQIQQIMEAFSCPIKEFRCNYLHKLCMTSKKKPVAGRWLAGARSFLCLMFSVCLLEFELFWFYIISLLRCTRNLLLLPA
jgi:hypothetical protein